MQLKLRVKPFSFHLLQTLQTSQGIIRKKQGWLINLENESGDVGWGEISPLNKTDLINCERILIGLGSSPSREMLEQDIREWPGALGFAFGTALAELDCLIGNNSMQNWLTPSSSAILLPTKESLLLKALDFNLETHWKSKKPLTFKWKVAIQRNTEELNLLQKILARLPLNARLRLDANGGWNRSQANEWSQQLHDDPRLEWFEQPLPPEDIQGMTELAKRTPIALDESLIYKPSLRETWQSWQIRRPALEGDPRDLLRRPARNNDFLVFSTAFETGIGFRWVKHLAALQQQSAQPIQPGLAPGWCPKNQLFSDDPNMVWKAA